MNSIGEPSWAYDIAKDLIKRGEKHAVATGITPSGRIHIGNLREILTAEAVRMALVELGAEVRLIYIADTYDPLRQIPPSISDYEDYIGFPISEIPDPEDCCQNYAEHFLDPFLDGIRRLGIEMEVFRADEMYKDGVYIEATKKALMKSGEIAKIIEERSGKRSPPDWTPFNPICDECGRITTTSVKSYDTKRNVVDYTCKCGNSGCTSMRRGKLTWRVDWPARWMILGVTVEPFGKDHAVSGSSYDTGVLISRMIYDYEPPYPIPFEHILLKGRKMSSSKDVSIPIEDILDVISPKVVKYLIWRTKPEKHIEFDPGVSLLNLVDEYDRMMNHIPFGHMINVVQIAHDFDHLLEILRRSSYDVSDIDEIEKDADRARIWLDKFAPDIFKFEIRDELPDGAKLLSDEQKEALFRLSNGLDRDADGLHDEIYEISNDIGIKPEKIFEAIYVSLLGRRSGPRAGLFLASLDREFLRERFREVYRN
jgi:lysyl-tRNA synthetase class 1